MFLFQKLVQFLLIMLIIERVTETHFLGIEINSDLNWKKHINIVASKVARAIGVIGRIKHRLSKQTLMLLYDSLISSHIMYCNIVWASTYKSSLEKLYLLQNSALKLCSGEKSYIYQRNAQIKTNTLSIFQSYNKLSVYDLNKYQIAKFTYNAINKLSPSCFWPMFSSLSSIHLYNTRADERSNLFLRHAKNNFFKVFHIS